MGDLEEEEDYEAFEMRQTMRLRHLTDSSEVALEVTISETRRTTISKEMASLMTAVKNTALITQGRLRT